MTMAKLEDQVIAFDRHWAREPEAFLKQLMDKAVDGEELKFGITPFAVRFARALTRDQSASTGVLLRRFLAASSHSDDPVWALRFLAFLLDLCAEMPGNSETTRRQILRIKAMHQAVGVVAPSPEEWRHERKVALALADVKDEEGPEGRALEFASAVAWPLHLAMDEAAGAIGLLVDATLKAGMREAGIADVSAEARQEYRICSEEVVAMKAADPASPPVSAIDLFRAKRPRLVERADAQQVFARVAVSELVERIATEASMLCPNASA
ncbi:MAG: hypothetical protein P4L76_17125 [Beijerinckiaceae bacterium]|nr:hypothetical protein [Beijerinckiaceae bacterium]